jgi:hypothetical protein
MSERRRLRVYPDWPCLIGLVAPIPAGVGLGLMSDRIRWDDGLGVLIGLLMFVLPLSVAASYWMSCRVADRSGQPWALMSFFVALAGWWSGIVMFFSFAGTFANKG